MRDRASVAEPQSVGKDPFMAGGSLVGVEVLLVSRDPRSRETMSLAVRSIERRLGTELRFRAAADGRLGVRAALRDRPEIVVADEFASREGAFSLARTLRDDAQPFEGVIVVLLERKHDSCLAEWSGADAWFVKPPDPFELAGRLVELLEERGILAAPAGASGKEIG